MNILFSAVRFRRIVDHAAAGQNTLIEPERRVVGIEVGADDYRRKFEELVVAAQATQRILKSRFWSGISTPISTAIWHTALKRRRVFTSTNRQPN